ncbi:MAG: hypothetical protein AMXMBFR84_10100 [Candidatus Hydrogenedentota bacterium]
MADKKSMPPVHPVRGLLEFITGPWSVRNLVEWVGLIIGILTVWWLLVQPFRIPSDSMVPTLEGDERFFSGDRVFVNKLAYGIHLPFTTKRILTWDAPKRWDIVVFRTINPAEGQKVLIKRVVGLPGETIRIRDHKVYVNGEAVEMPERMPDVKYFNLDDYQSVLRAAESEDDVRNALGIIQSYPVLYGCSDVPEYSVVPEGHYLMLGDNSQHSFDGRFYGWVPERHIFGRAFCVWWPFSRWSDLTGFSGTWWGKLLLFGIPASLIGFEFFRWRMSMKRAKT